jgi:hypothetical protein
MIVNPKPTEEQAKSIIHDSDLTWAKKGMVVPEGC